MEVLIVRHGQSEYNAKMTDNMDSRVTYRGYSQADQVGRWLRDNFELRGYKGLTSPYQRCLQTSLLIHRYTGLDFEVIDDIREWDHRQVKVVGIPDRQQEYPMFTWTGPWPSLTRTETKLSGQVGDFVVDFLCFLLCVVSED